MRNWLKTLREGKHFTMKEMAEHLGISESYYCAIENGSRQKKMDIILICNIARIFNLPVEQVVAYEAAYLKASAAPAS